jgi:tetratricopeptide (TPR) repeat protein
MAHWLNSLPSEVSYGLVTAALLGAAAWVYSRLRPDHQGSSREGEGAAVDSLSRPSISIGEIKELHLHPTETHAQAPPVPRSLPRGPLRFFNRKSDIAELEKLLDRSKVSPGPVVAVINGMHGVGKSAIGIHWAREKQGLFPDGALFGDFSKRRRGRSVLPSDVLGEFLESMGTSEMAIPSDLAGKQQLFERRTSERRLLVVLDDVEHDAQALALLPSGAGSVVLVTTNFPLEELLREGAIPLPLQPLDHSMSLELLAEMAGEDRLAKEPTAVDALIEVCGGLPVALCVCGGSLAAHPDRSVSRLAGEITDAAHPLHVLSPSGAYETAAVFEFAYRDLPAQGRLVYRRLGLAPGVDFTAASTAPLANISTAAAAETLDLLVSAHLLDAPAPGRYRPHELVRDHMRESANSQEGARSMTDALLRQVDWYYASLRVADRAVFEDRLRLGDSASPAADGIPKLDHEAAAFEWYDSERRNVMAVLRAAFDREWDDRVWQIAETLWPLAANRKRFSEWIESHQLAVRSAVRLNDSAVEARMRSQLARAYSEQGEPKRAREEMDLALEAVESCDDNLLKASVVEFSGVCRLEDGDIPLALESFSRASSMFASSSSERGQAIQDYHTGWALLRCGDPEAALQPLTEARATMARIGDKLTLGRVLLRRGDALAALRRYGPAKADLTEAIEVLESIGIWFERAQAHEVLAEVAEMENDTREARAQLQGAYRIYREFGHPRADQLLTTLEGSI